MSDRGSSGLVLEARDIRATYGEVLALEGVNFGVPRHDVVAVLGANGAGKSTLLSVLAGDMRPVRGSVRYDGSDVTGRPPWSLARAGVCTIPEGAGVFYDLSVVENLRLAAAASGHRNRDLSDVYELFPRLGERRSQVAGSMSGGEKQMLALSRAVVTEPEVLLVDEPSLGLAPVIVDEVFAVLQRLNREAGLSIVVVEQYVEKALAIADWVVMLRKGRVELACAKGDLPGQGAFTAGYFGDQGAPEVGAEASLSRNGHRRRRRPLQASTEQDHRGTT